MLEEGAAAAAAAAAAEGNGPEPLDRKDELPPKSTMESSSSSSLLLLLANNGGISSKLASMEESDSCRWTYCIAALTESPSTTVMYIKTSRISLLLRRVIQSSTALSSWLLLVLVTMMKVCRVVKPMYQDCSFN